MNQEKFVNSYIELLTATITESIQKSLVLQAQNKVAEQEIRELTELIASSDKRHKEELKMKQNDIDSYKHQLEEMRKQKDVFIAESFELKKNVDHIGTFKEELVKSRKENERLLLRIQELENKTQGDTKVKLNFVENINANVVSKLSKPDVEPKKINKKHLVKEIKEIEDAGNF